MIVGAWSKLALHNVDDHNFSQENQSSLSDQWSVIRAVLTTTHVVKCIDDRQSLPSYNATHSLAPSTFAQVKIVHLAHDFWHICPRRDTFARSQIKHLVKGMFLFFFLIKMLS